MDNLPEGSPWHSHRDTIRLLYFDQGKTQEAVRKIMSEQYGIPSKYVPLT
jgi:hypothetical protein